jgi:epidermal growth factor receptor substrate 15
LLACLVGSTFAKLTLRYSETPAGATISTDLNNLSSSNVDDIFGSAGANTATNTASRPATGATASKAVFDDLDDDFEGLEDAKEGSADDDFANISRSGLDDFNPVFDSSPPPSQPKSESANTSAAFGVESSFDFGSLSNASAAGSAAGAVTTNQPGPAASQAKAPPAPQSTADSHDWDAIFAGLDDTPTASSQTLAASSDGNGDGNGNGRNGSTAAASADAAARPPAPGRALTEEGEHDDPILKNLTGMGYPRQEALAALEKYDYDLERVSINRDKPPAASAFASASPFGGGAATGRLRVRGLRV